jgi:hypothetical protein
MLMLTLTRPDAAVGLTGPTTVTDAWGINDRGQIVGVAGNP